jgi:hypothetical protein
MVSQLPTAQPTDIVAGADGNLWFTELQGNRLGRISPSGAVTEIDLSPTPRAPSGIPVGPDANIWFTELVGDRIGSIVAPAPVTIGPVLQPTATPTPSPVETSSEVPTATPAMSPPVTATTAPTAWTSDCNGDATVTVDELLLMTNIGLGSAPVGSCAAGDASDDGTITVDETLAAVNNTLNGCAAD